MGFYLRKAIKLGPIRLNLSKSGIGLSAGVKGLRCGVRPNGRAYVHAGRYGLYYRQELGSRDHEDVRDSRSIRPPTEVYEAIPAAAIGKLSRANLASLLGDAYAHVRVDSVVAIIASVTCVVAFAVGWFLGSIAIVLSIALFVATNLWEVRRRTVYVHYEMSAPFARTFERLVASFNDLAACEGVWALTSATRLSGLTEFKRNAGASSLVDRCKVSVGEGVPPWVKTNIQIPTIQSRGQTLYFLPDGALVYDHTGVGFVKYAEFDVSAGSTNFIEQSAPSDAQIIRYTWLHPNVDGGPDRRFASNRQLPVCLYGEAAIRSPHGLVLLLQTSRCDASAAFKTGIEYISAEHARSGPDGAEACRPWVGVNAEHFQSPATFFTTYLNGAVAIATSTVSGLDAVLKSVAGDGNDIVHNFLRVLAAGAIAVSAVLVFYLTLVSMFGR